MNNAVLNFLERCTAINSSYPEEYEFSRYVDDYLKERGFDTIRQKIDSKRFNIVAEKGTGSSSVVLYGHLDTVAAGAGWRTDPLKLTVKGDRAYGLGSWDMKGSMSVILDLFCNFNPKNIKLKLALCGDEENYSQGGYVLMNSGFLDDAECIISPEPAFLYGLQGITSGRIGRAVYSLNIIGNPYHFAHYDTKLDINLLTSEVIFDLKKLYKINNLGKEFAFVRAIDVRAKGMSLPGNTSLEIDTSVLPPKSHKQMMANIENIVQKRINASGGNFKFTLEPYKRPTPPLESYSILQNNKYLGLLKTSVESITGKPGVPYFRSSVADDNVFGAMGKTVLGIGPEGGNAHAPNEWVSLSALEKLGQILLDFLQRADI